MKIQLAVFALSLVAACSQQTVASKEDAIVEPVEQAMPQGRASEPATVADHTPSAVPACGMKAGKYEASGAYDALMGVKLDATPEDVRAAIACRGDIIADDVRAGSLDWEGPVQIQFEVAHNGIQESYVTEFRGPPGEKVLKSIVGRVVIESEHDTAGSLPPPVEQQYGPFLDGRPDGYFSARAPDGSVISDLDVMKACGQAAMGELVCERLIIYQPGASTEQGYTAAIVVHEQQPAPVSQ